MEGMGGSQMKDLFHCVYAGRKVLVTGHTGFKGSWLCLWLQELGATVAGFSLDPPSEPSHWDLLGLPIVDGRGDIRDEVLFKKFVKNFQPEIVFHLAAQPIVRESYRKPLETFSSNVMGSLMVYDACRECDSVRAVVSITTDKVYENREWCWGYRENDPLGGHDPYSASKACADIATTSWRRSFWPPLDYGKTHHVLMATARAGNVIGGGDWALDRLVPDLMRATMTGREAIIRNPRSTRPWEHVLEPLSGYLLLGEHLWEGRTEMAKAWNFGPASEGVCDVGTVVRLLRESLPELQCRVEEQSSAPHEAGLLTLDCSLAQRELQWFPVWDGKPCFARTAEWYRAFLDGGRVMSLEQLKIYVEEARRGQRVWTGSVSL